MSAKSSQFPAIWLDSCVDLQYCIKIMRKIDRTDLLLLKAMTTDARISHVDLAKRLGLSSTACARRLSNLEKDGFIEGYQAILGLKTLGLGTTIVIRVTLESQSVDALEAFEAAVVRCPSVVRCFLMSGTDDYLLTILTRGIEDFEHIHKTQLARLPRVARIQSSFAIREIINRSFPPAALSSLE